ncbi:MAG: hypothetical protein FWH33_01120 [Oscillospiraceae bacterium]|nr:hypothetical protein [Oscillospiraceae bacterium]
MDPVIQVVLVAIVPILVSLLICMIWRSKMKTAHIAREADNYIPEGGFRLTGHGDMFLYRTTTRTKINSGSSSTANRSGGGRR